MADIFPSQQQTEQGLPPGLVRPLRIFLSSPGDVSAERKIALSVIEQLRYEPQFKGKVSLEPVAWDNPGAGPVLPATESPQEAIDQGLTRPADCDIVAVIFWMRMGTPLPNPPYCKPNGEPYYSGAEYEYEKAMEGFRRRRRPQVVVYRRDASALDPDAADYQEKVEQYERVKTFFKQFQNLRGFYRYKKPADFERKFRDDLRNMVYELLEAQAQAATLRSSPPPELWRGSPFPGLRAFTDADAPIFFGRGHEIDDLVDRINHDRFVAVVGASGSGKSSLVWAGLIPALKGNSIRTERAASSDWLWLRMTPGGLGDNPFIALAEELARAEELRPHLRREARDIAEELADRPEALSQLTPQILAGKPDWVELLLFIDQFEELVTLVAECYRAPFVEMLAQTIATGRCRVVATLRADFYHQMIPVSAALVELLQNGSYPLGAPDQPSLYEMIARPAERAGLQFEGDLARRIVTETGNEPGALALMAYLLDELYQRQDRRKDGRLTRRDYDDLGGVAGAIGKRAEQAFSQLSPEAQEALPQVFRRLVKVDNDGTATRRRAPLEEIERSRSGAGELVREFTKARLLVGDTAAIDPLRKNPTVEVAHEALLRTWDRLATWIRETQNDLRLVDQVKLDAKEWDREGRKDAYRWLDERLQPLYKAIDRLAIDKESEFSPAALEFIRPESDRLLEKIQNPDTPHIRRSEIGERLAMIGDPRPGVGLRPDGLPGIDWCKVELEGESSVEVQIEDKVGKVKVDLPFYIARYPVTYSQFQAFIDAKDGLGNRKIDWFEGLAAGKEEKELGEQRFKFPNHPREMVNWYQAIAFCRWLSWRLENAPLLAEEGRPEARAVSPGTASSPSETKESGFLNSLKGKGRRGAAKARKFDLMDPFTWAVRLPTEAEWQLAAAGSQASGYPWGNEWDGRFANTTESGLQRTTAVGMYPAGAAPSGALDMSGNVWEWTLTEHKSGKSGDITNQEPRVVRGGSWSFNQSGARAACRNSSYPDPRGDKFGFRVVGVVPSP